MHEIAAAPTLRICDLDVSMVTLSAAAAAMADYCASERRHTAPEPLYVTSVNGQVLSLCDRDPHIRRLFSQADVIHCDGQPLVLMSRLFGGRPLPERVATTDLFPLVAERAVVSGLTFYLLGGSREVNRRLMNTMRATFPRVAILGSSHGYLSEDEEAGVVEEIARLAPDILWIAMGVPKEQRFVVEHRTALRGVGLIKTSGGLFDFLTGSVKRAPLWMQKAGAEWLFRLLQEPKRLFWRYALTNPHALFLIMRGLLRNRAARAEGSAKLPF